MTVTVKVPKRFFNDHVDRDCLRGADNEQIKPDAVITRELSKHYVLTLTEAQAKELLSDANYYRDGGGGGMDFFELGGLIASAKATYNALQKVMVTQ
jgi:hypothetical protein